MLLFEDGDTCDPVYFINPYWINSNSFDLTVDDESGSTKLMEFLAFLSVNEACEDLWTTYVFESDGSDHDGSIVSALNGPQHPTFLIAEVSKI